jgi:hypothetical protein
MTRREKVLGFGVAGTLGGLALVMLVRWFVLEPFTTVRKDITDEAQRARRLHASLEQLDRVEDKWYGLTKRTFSEDPKEAQQRFREDLQQLLVERHGMTQAKISPGTFVRYKDGSTGVPLTINATGTLNQIVGFLCDFYRRDYLARLDKVRIQADMNVISNANTLPRERPTAPKSSRSKNPPAPATAGGPGTNFGPDGPELKLNISAVTLVLPRMKDMEHPVTDAALPELEHGRLLRELPDYNLVFTINPFMPYRKEEKIVVTPPPETAPAPPSHVEAPLPPPPPPLAPTRVGADQQIVVCTTALNGQPLTYVLDKSNTDTPVKKYFLDDVIDDGTLLLILPRGLVVAARQPDGREHNFFYPLGRTFSDREEVNPDSHPEVVAALEEAFVP